MRLPPRFAPPTQLDALRKLLSGFSEGDRTFQAQFDKSLQVLRQLALPELGQRLARNTTPLPLRQLILETVVKFDWPEWDKYLIPMLEHEEDLALFGEGCKALGGLCTRRAKEGLQKLKNLCQDAERQEILERELGWYQPDRPYESRIEALMAGQANPGLARQGAGWVAVPSSPAHQSALVEAFHKGDQLTRHLVLHILTCVEVPEDLLLHLFEVVKAESLECWPLVKFAAQLETLAGKAQKDMLLTKLGECFTASTPELLAALRAKLIDSQSPNPDLGPIQAEVRGPLRAFLMKALLLLVQGKALGFSSLLKETIASTATFQAEYDGMLEDLAEFLAAKVDAKQLAVEQVLPVLEDAMHASMGGEGLRIAFLRLIPCDDQERLDRILAEPDVAKRVRCIETLGAREDDRLAPFFLKAMNDPAKEVGQLSIHQLGKLPSGLPGMMDLFRSDQVDRVREAIRFFHENQTKAAVKPLMTFLSSEAPDDLLVDAASALGNIGDPACTNALLNQLHSGKPLALQVAIVEALANFRTPAASLGLLKKSLDLTLSEALLLALKGSLAAFPSLEQPFPPDQIPDLEHLLERCCDPREGAAHCMNAMLAMLELYTFNAGAYNRLIERFSGFLLDMRQKLTWDKATNDVISEGIRTLSRRATRLSSIEDREKALQASIEAIPETGLKRLQVLVQLRETLLDSEYALGEGSAKILVGFMWKAFFRPNLDFAEVDLLCQIAGLTKQASLIEPLEDLFAHADSSSIKGAARKALLALGLTPQEIELRKPIKSILLLEPNAFFRNRLVPHLTGHDRTIDVAATREEAQTLLDEKRVDLLISESQDPGGDLWEWIEQAWRHRRCRYALLSTSNHDPGPLTGKPWVIGRLFKPYPVEALIRIIKD
jgi:hypothetical protein